MNYSLAHTAHGDIVLKDGVPMKIAELVCELNAMTLLLEAYHSQVKKSNHKDNSSIGSKNIFTWKRNKNERI